MKIEAYLDEKTFRRFTMFDILKRRKYWKSPVTFASILSVSAIICFIMHRVDGAVLLGTVLLVVGLGMPLIHFLNFFFSLRKLVAQQALKTPRLVYTLTLTEKSKGIEIDNGKEHAVYEWKQVFHAYRDTDATYLYLTPERAFLLPHDYIMEGDDGLWKLIDKKVSKDRRTDIRKKKDRR